MKEKFATCPSELMAFQMTMEVRTFTTAPVMVREGSAESGAFCNKKKSFTGVAVSHLKIYHCYFAKLLSP